MKRIIFSLIALVVLSSSCERNLDPELPGTINTNNFFRTPGDLNAAATAIYHELRLGGWGPYLFSDGSSLVMDEVATDEWTTKWAWSNFLNGNWIINEAMTTGFYDWLNPAVTRATYTLAKMDESPVAPEAKKVVMAEVRALRAFFVYDLYRFYGPLPLITDYTHALQPDPDYKPNRPSEQEVETFIVDELRTAANDLPVAQTEFGKVTKGAALHYLLKFYMRKKDWSEAVHVADEIINLNHYQLETDYEKIFRADNKGNRELIFTIAGEARDQYGNHTFVNIIPGDFQSPHGSSQSLDGWNGHRMPWAFYNTFHENDLRRDLSWAEYTNKSNQTVNLRTTDIGALPLKYGIDPQAFGIWAGNDKVMDRYAEVLLFKAEALNEINGPNQESIDLINQIRGRAFGTPTGVLPSMTLLDEKFEIPIEGNKAGIFNMNKYDEAASWSYEIDNTDKLGDQNALKIDVANSGSEFWALQVRNETFTYETGRQYKLSFIALSDKNIRFDIRFENGFDHVETISLEANTPTEIEIETSESSRTGNNANVMLALGNSGSNFTLWIDNFKVTSVAKQIGGDNEYSLKLVDFPDKGSLRDHILKERGWEFWYEGKRREDLIRMGKYIEEGKKYAFNFSEKNLLFPIPQWAIIENPNLKQNPGYN
ncbi:RagB/SusD family nutrient uptake outer membrane protein [Sphingobacterium chuzhouense]|uniref:RagB/SusD family nutrient uptake outer membrane protein n=1 Tax=Sphingobacterium chuzhouense TaxID=1742264 RepID=A0ABR7XN43_9SPHI|nr:RagB/SusD family nutrient uptake outer membrane protein [Sphingobacterium chuzhouense]MBD1420596.1 RagB/SusD family nutrient uptake outer membrane protein [Sphingobacterium chuzhouense]